MFGIDLNNSPLGLFSFLMVGAAVKLTALEWLRRKRSEKFECVGRVHALYTYPVKSCSGVEIGEADAGLLGLKYKGTLDRHWMVIKGRNPVKLKNAESLMKRITVIPLGFGDLRLEAPGMPSLTLEMNKFRQIISCKLNTTNMDVIDCGDEASDWFSTFLHQDNLRLVYSPPHLTKREAVNMSFPWNNDTKKGDLTAFSHLTSYHVTSASSLHDLNHRLDTPVSIVNFRPNIVIEGTAPYDEDNWAELRIGNTVHLRVADVSVRCYVTTMDPRTGEISVEKQPYETLRSYRCKPPYGSKPVFGVYCALEVEGHIKVGDSVYILRKDKETNPSL